jgi:hypothetical protein
MGYELTNSQIPSPFCAHPLTISPAGPTPFPLPSLQSQVSATATRHPPDIAQPGPSLTLPYARHRRPSLLLLRLFEIPQPQHTCASRSYAVPVSVFRFAIDVEFPSLIIPETHREFGYPAPWLALPGSFFGKPMVVSLKNLPQTRK